MPDRYRGRPMLLVIDNYALAVIGVLPREKEEAVRTVVKSVFKGGDDWRATVRTTMAWPANVDDEIRANWDEYKRKARAEGSVADPVVFARAFGDEFSKY